MRVSEMSGQDALVIFDYADNYPLRVILDGKAAELDRAAVEALRKANRDFEVDEAQAARILTEHGSC